MGFNSEFKGLRELHNEPNTVNVIKYSRLMWAGHVVLMDDEELPKKKKKIITKLYSRRLKVKTQLYYITEEGNS